LHFFTHAGIERAVRSELVDPEALITNVRVLRKKTAAYIITGDELTQAKNVGQPRLCKGGNLMSQFDLKKNWWIVITATAVVGIGLILLTEQLLPKNKDVGAFLSFGLLGAAFCWVYTTNKERLWWAIIPGLGLFSVLVGVLAAALQTKDENESSWLGVLVLGIGAAVIGALLKRTDAKLVLYFVAMIIVAIAVAMIPVAWLLRGVLIAVVVLGTGFYLWRFSGLLRKSG
jgi:hypothetical protein